jgi:hypothetical protein
VDALFRGILGILIGATIHAEVYPLIQGNVMQVGSFGKLTFPDLFGVNAWALIVPVVLAFGGFLAWVDRKGL